MAKWYQFKCSNKTLGKKLPHEGPCPKIGRFQQKCAKPLFVLTTHLATLLAVDAFPTLLKKKQTNISHFLLFHVR